MKKVLMSLIITILLIYIVGCSSENNNNNTLKEELDEQAMNNSDGESETEIYSKILSVNELIFDDNELEELGIIKAEDECTTEEYQTSESSPLQQLSTCFYKINNLEASEVIIILNKFTNLNDLEGSYQYNSMHLRSADGIISEDDYGDKSRFLENSENDYGAEYNDPSIYYYHLWIVKDLYLIHITSKGAQEDKEYIEKIGEKILSKFE